MKGRSSGNTMGMFKKSLISIIWGLRPSSVNPLNSAHSKSHNLKTLNDSALLKRSHEETIVPMRMIYYVKVKLKELLGRIQGAKNL